MTDKTTTKPSIKGVVSKISSTNTLRIETKITKVHPIYKKRYTVKKHHIAHFEDDKIKVGDMVAIEPCRPVSKSKKWQVITRLTKEG